MTDPTQAVEVLARALANASARGQEPYVFTTRARTLLAEIAPQIRAEALEEAARVRIPDPPYAPQGHVYDTYKRGWDAAKKALRDAIREMGRG